MLDKSKNMLYLYFIKQQNIKAMTLQDLKANRTEIINRINEIADTTKMAEIMKDMVKIAEAGYNETENPVDFVDEIVRDFGYQKKYTGKNIYDLMEESARNQRSSSMRY